MTPFHFITIELYQTKYKLSNHKQLSAAKNLWKKINYLFKSFKYFLSGKKRKTE